MSLLLTLVALGWLGWHAHASPGRLERLRARQVRAEELRGGISHLDEVLTMSARMAAATGDPAWQARYDAAAPVLDTMLAEATRMVPIAARTEAANRRLVALERQGFALVRARRGAEARALLAGPVYARAKRTYADGLDAYARALRAQGVDALARERRRAGAGAAAALLGIVAALAGWVRGARALRRWRAGMDASVRERTASLAAANAALERSLGERETADRRFQAIFERSAVGITIVDDDGRLVTANDAFGAFVGRPVADLVGCRVAALSPAEDAAVTRAPVRAIRAGERDRVTVEKRFLHPDGEVRWGMLTLSRIDTGHGMGLVGMVQDVTARKRLEGELTHQAFHDALTGLANRALFQDRVAHALSRAGRQPESSAVLFLDLDDFKAVNDTLGHAAGDRLLQAVAARLLNATRGCDTVARLGGDEFAVLLENVNHDADATAVAERALAAIGAPVALGDGVMVPRASVGIARAALGTTADELLRDADVAMYRAKQRGAGGFEQFVPAMREAVVTQRALEADLRGALEGGAGAGHFGLAFQPIVALDEAAGPGGGVVTGAEALLRWQHPSRGPVAPLEFVPLAERTGLIVPIGRWVLHAACREAAGWPARGAAGAPAVTVNVSGRQLEDGTFVDDVAGALAATGLAAGRLVLEITETALVQNAEATLARLHALKALGVQVAIDDFGTGYSSLAYLQRFPVDVLKIDKAFVDGVARGGHDAALARAIVALGRTLGLRTVAEGVEDAAQCEHLRALGCGYGQGYLFARPLPPAELAELLRTRAASSP